jgi:subtilisin family serine protease
VICHLPPYRVDAVASALPSSGVDWSLSAYGIPALWSQHQGAGVRVAVLDSGIEPGHPALAGAVKEHRNFTTDCSPYDTNGHGTHVAGVLAGRGAMLGVAPKAELLSFKVLNNNGAGSLQHVSQAIEAAIEAKAHIIVMSLGCPVSVGYLQEACARACAHGIAVVCAAGNDGGSVNYPAAYGCVIAVGAVDQEGKVCEFSCRGKEIAVAAPGHQITSAWLGCKYATLSGTSMAAPFVAGVLALHAGKCGTEMLSQKAAEILRETSTDAGAPGRDGLYGWGLINPISLVGNGCRVIV